MNLLSQCLLIILTLAVFTSALPTQGTVTEVSSFTIPKSPSGMFYDADQDLLYILCGTQTNGDHYLYAYTTAGVQQCFITIPSSVGMSRVDGFYIVGDKAYIVDSQGPIYASDAGKLGGSIYEVDWTDPCSCTAASCTESTVTWTPTVNAQIYIDATDDSVGDGGGVDDYYRNSGIVIKGTSVYAVNGVHPVNGLTCCYPKSLLELSLTDTTGTATALSKWSFDATTIGHDVDMEGLTCGADECDDYIYIGDEYNYVYKLDLSETDSATAVTYEWDLNSLVGNIPDDKGIESLTYASTTGYFYAGIQETAEVFVVSLTESASTTPSPATSPTTTTPTPSPSPVPTPTTTVPTPTSSGSFALPSALASLTLLLLALF